MRSLILHLVNLVSVLLPQSRCFRLRADLYRLAGVRIGPGALINGSARIHHPNLEIASDAWIGAGTQLIATPRGSITIGEHVGVGPGVMFCTGTHEIGETWRRTGAGKSLPISVGAGSWISARVTFVAGSGVGRSCVVAAGAVVTQMFPDNVVVAGVPARVIRELPPPTD